MRSFPELLDIGIMGHCDSGEYCRKAGIDCYQKGFTVCAPHMSYESFLEIVKQASGKTFQIALGGAGDPNKHPQFEDILQACRAYRIVPNITTSGFQLIDNEVKFVSVLFLRLYRRSNRKKVQKKRSTANYWKLAALKQLRKEMERLEHEEQKADTF